MHIAQQKSGILSITVKVQNPTYVGTNTGGRRWLDLMNQSHDAHSLLLNVLYVSSLSHRNAASKRSKAAWTGQPDQPAQLQLLCCWRHLLLCFQFTVCFFTAVSVCNSCPRFYCGLFPRRGIWGADADGEKTFTVTFSIFVFQLKTSVLVLLRID